MNSFERIGLENDIIRSYCDYVGIPVSFREALALVHEKLSKTKQSLDEALGIHLRPEDRQRVRPNFDVLSGIPDVGEETVKGWRQLYDSEAYRKAALFVYCKAIKPLLPKS